MPLRDDGIHTWIHPAERFAHQLQAVAEMPPLRPAELGRYARGATALAEKAPSPQTQAEYLELLAGLWSEVAQVQPLMRPETLANLLGLRYEVDGPSSSLREVLAEGAGGSGVIAVRVRTQPWSKPGSSTMPGCAGSRCTPTTSPVRVCRNAGES